MADCVIGRHSDNAPLTVATTVVVPDRAAWDAFVAKHPDGHLLQSSRWGSLKERFGWTPHLRAVVAGDAIQAGALALEKQRFGLSALYVPRGPIFSGDLHIDTLLLEDLIRLGWQRRAVFVRIEPNIMEHDPRAAPLHAFLITHALQPTTTIQPRSTIHLDLAPEPERLLAGMSKGHRADIKRALREGVEVRESATSTDLNTFYTIMQATSARAGFAIHSLAYYASVLELFGDAVRLWLAEYRGAPVATAMTAVWGTMAIYLYSGSTTEGLRCGAQHAIQWHAIRWARARGATRYDFWGIPDAIGQASLSADPTTRACLETAAQRDPLYGVYRFKKGFGGITTCYLSAYDWVGIPLLYALWRWRATW
ncbi:MAG: lipid II:glycine glycyltransferase FemX [Roseiflexus sp.]